MGNPLLEINNLKTHFQTQDGKITVVDGLSLKVTQGEILGVVGESGCGKSVTFQSVLRLFDNDRNASHEGKINFKGNNLFDLKENQMQSIRGKEISMIFQDPLSSFNPVHTIGRQISEVIMLHKKQSKTEAHKKSIEMLRLTGIPSPEKRANQYPHQLSGGMLQRAMIAMALSCDADLLIADEPTTALDVTIQLQLLNLIQRLNSELDMGIILITHDLGVIAEMCSRVVVMYLGQIVEESSTDLLFEKPLHPYTKGLMKSIPLLDGDRTKKLYTIKGTVPSMNNVPNGCRFASRCPYATELCHKQEPQLEMYKGRKVRCWHVDSINNENWNYEKEEDKIEL